MGSHLNVYQYQPLRPREIRILRIHVDNAARPQDITIDLQCSLQVVSLDQCGEFDALSYSWGYATMDEQVEWSRQTFTTVQSCYPIEMDGKLALITRSLRNALRRLRQALHPLSRKYAANQGQSELAARSEYI
jgi:hypothetical protein